MAETETMAPMPEIDKDEIEQVRARAFRPLLACGLCFAMLLLMGLSGVASITLMYDDPMYIQAMKGVEGAVARAVTGMDWLIRFIHTWGGYAAIVLAGWAGTELLIYGRRLRKTGDAGWRKTGKRLPFIGVFGSLMLIASLLVLIGSGIAAQGYMRVGYGDLPDPELNRDRMHERNVEPREERPIVEWHIRELNYFMALGAIVLVLGAGSVRNAANEARQKLKE